MNIQKEDVIKRATEVFGDISKGMSWLESTNTGLGGVAPISLLDDEGGIKTVMDTLGRIEHGVYM